MIEMARPDSIAAGRANERCGEYIRTVIELFECGDSVCDCSQVVVVEHYRNKLAPGATWFVQLAEGHYCTEGRGDDDRTASEIHAEDVAEAQHLFPNAQVCA